MICCFLPFSCRRSPNPGKFMSLVIASRQGVLVRRQAVSTASRRAYGRSRKKESTRRRWAKTWGGTASSGLANLDFHSSRNGAPDRIGDGGVGIAPLHDRPQALRRHPGGPYPDVRPGTERTGRNGVVHTHQAAIVGLAVHRHLKGRERHGLLGGA